MRGDIKTGRRRVCDWQTIEIIICQNKWDGSYRKIQKYDLTNEEQKAHEVKCHTGKMTDVDF